MDALPVLAGTWSSSTAAHSDFFFLLLFQTRAIREMQYLEIGNFD
jgi:hypothetical protein